MTNFTKLHENQKEKVEDITVAAASVCSVNIQSLHLTHRFDLDVLYVRLSSCVMFFQKFHDIFHLAFGVCPTEKKNRTILDDRIHVMLLLRTSHCLYH